MRRGKAIEMSGRRIAAMATVAMVATGCTMGSDYVRNGVILSLVASVATSYIQLRGYDTQLAIAK